MLTFLAKKSCKPSVPCAAKPHQQWTPSLISCYDMLKMLLLMTSSRCLTTAGTFPAPWKHANISLIPKPNKTLAPEHLRHISLTCCLGKLLGNVVNTRLTAYVDKHQPIPPNMIGFCPRLPAYKTFSLRFTLTFSQSHLSSTTLPSSHLIRIRLSIMSSTTPFLTCQPTQSWQSRTQRHKLPL